MIGPASAAAGSDIARLRDELDQQRRQLDWEKSFRLGATMLAFAMGLIYLPASVIVPLALINVLADLTGGWLFREPDRLAASALRRAAVIVTVCLMEITFVLPAAIMWHVDDTFAKCLAIGLAASSMMQLSTGRSIHLPQGLWGGAALVVVVLVSNAAYWTMRGDWLALGLSTLCAMTASGYCLMAMISNHQVHRRSAARNRAAIEAAAAKDRLLATISHELRTPLNGILGMGHVELAQAGSPEARARLGVLVASAEGLSVILDDILDISAARDGRLAIWPAVWIPAEEIEAIMLLFRHGAGDRGVDVTLELAPELSQPARFDRQRLRQCLSNLVSNALRHGQGAALRVRAAQIVAADGRALLDLTVADDGPGVPEALRDILFEPFARLPGPAPEGARHGQGLGLSIARSLARAMGGDVVLLPPGVHGSGAVFRLTLDLTPAPKAKRAQAFRELPEHAKTQPERRVLVVDDIATNRLVAISCLGLAGAEGSEADSGAAALEQLATASFDAVLLDMNMPGLDGLATLARIRALDGPAARVKVIAMTADSGDARRKHYLAAGCDGYLAKPVTPDSIAAALSAIATRRPAGAV